MQHGSHVRCCLGVCSGGEFAATATLTLVHNGADTGAAHLPCCCCSLCSSLSAAGKGLELIRVAGPVASSHIRGDPPLSCLS
jgi:hypothetical protein